MRLWCTTKHENSQTGRKSFIFNTRSGYFHSSVNHVRYFRIANRTQSAAKGTSRDKRLAVQRFLSAYAEIEVVD
jgi:hypothetical protein